MKRVFCLFLTLVMVLSCGVYAFAAEKAAKYVIGDGYGFLRGGNGDVVGFQLTSDGRTVDMNHPISMEGGSPYFGKDIYVPLVNESYNPNLDISALNAAKSTADTNVTNAQNALNTANSLKTTYQGYQASAQTFNSVTYNTFTDCTTDLKNLLNTCLSYTFDESTFSNEVIHQKLSQIISKYETEITDLDISGKETALSKAKTAQEKANNDLNTAKNAYYFVNEAKAVGAGDSYKSKLTVKGIDSSTMNTLTKKYINPDNIELVKMKAVSNSYYGLKESDLSTNRIYFIKIPIAATSKKVELDNPLEGTVILKKTTGADENEFEIGFEFYLFPEFNMASSSSSYYAEVYKTAQWYEEGSGFESTDEFEFRFNADGDRSFFVVDTTRQTKAIQLSFNKDWNEAEQEYLDSHEGYNFDYDFYNGYSSSNFTRQGTLYLYWSDDEDYNKAYVYYIDDANNKALTLVASGRPDGGEWYEDGCFAIKTNKLGRYLISSKQLSITRLMDLPGPTQEELEAQAAAEAQAQAEAERIAAEEAARKAAEEEAARRAAEEEAARKAAEEEAARLAEEAKKAAEQQAKPITPAIEKDEGMPIIAWVAIIGVIVLAVIALGVVFYTRGNSKKFNNESSHSNKNNSNKRRML